jgi:hypothetical protein
MKKFTLTLALSLAGLFSATLASAQTVDVYPTVGIIGSATAKGWDASTPMALTNAADVHQWSLTLNLTQNEVKFRANDAWLVNWGAATFPSGLGTRDGANIPVASAGTYIVQFNDVTGAYLFTKQTATPTTAAQSALLKLALAPNPARETARIAYELPTAATATVAVQNLLGQTVRQFAPVRQAAGSQQQQLSLQGLTPGIYLVQLHTGTLTQTARLSVN